MKSQDEILFKWGRAVTPSVLRVTPSMLLPKQITIPCREHCVYVIIHVIEGVDNIFVTSDDQ